jgi:hypothetical protein
VAFKAGGDVESLPVRPILRRESIRGKVNAVPNLGGILAKARAEFYAGCFG